MSIALLTGLTLDLLIGWPSGLFRRIGHPVTWIGKLTSSLENRLNAGSTMRRRLAGLITALAVCSVTGGLALAVSRVLPSGWTGYLLLGLLGWPLIAARSLYVHVRDVWLALALDDRTLARSRIARIVGRDPEQLDEAGIARAALESLAENTSDGVIAPIFWGVLIGLPGIVVYKAINTMDSMIGYRTHRYADFGWAAARLDDLVNLVPARLTGLMIAAASMKPGAFRVMLRDAGLHRSPNAGWPEAAMAGAIGIRLAGPRQYPGAIANDPWLNEGALNPSVAEIKRGLNLYCRVIAMLGLTLGCLAGAAYVFAPIHP